jgi:hypothetical protein
MHAGSNLPLNPDQYNSKERICNMLYIITGSAHQDKPTYSTWHVGEKVKLPVCPVITFQADGHELEVIINALKKNGGK